jgi:uncharacterized protein
MAGRYRPPRSLDRRDVGPADTAARRDTCLCRPTPWNSYGRPTELNIERNQVMSNIETVKGVYEAFGRGDIPAILEVIADDIEWEYGMADTGVPWLRSRTGRDGARQFFASLAGVEFHTFDPRVLLDHDDLVVALIDVSFTVKDTGVVVTEEDEVHIWTFDANGKVSRFCHKLDTHQHWAAVGCVKEAT